MGDCWCHTAVLRAGRPPSLQTHLLPSSRRQTRRIAPCRRATKTRSCDLRPFVNEDKAFKQDSRLTLQTTKPFDLRLKRPRPHYSPMPLLPSGKFLPLKFNYEISPSFLCVCICCSSLPPFAGSLPAVRPSDDVDEDLEICFLTDCHQIIMKPFK